METENGNLIGLPVGFPQKLVSAFVWEGQKLAGKYPSVYALSEPQVVEVQSALEHVDCTVQSRASCSTSLS